MHFHKTEETLIPSNYTVIQKVLHLLNGIAFQNLKQLKSIILLCDILGFQIFIGALYSSR